LSQNAVISSSVSDTPSTITATALVLSIPSH
jgi:hypothetical protein